MADAFEKFARHICEFLDEVSDIPMHKDLVFTVEIKKVGRAPNNYHLKNPLLQEAENQKESPIILPH